MPHADFHSYELLSCNSGYGLLPACIVRPDGNTKAHYVTLGWTSKEFSAVQSDVKMAISSITQWIP